MANDDPRLIAARDFVEKVFREHEGTPTPVCRCRRCCEAAFALVGLRQLIAGE